MKKLFLLLFVVIMVLPVFSQRNTTDYRINRIFSAACGEDELFYYEGNSTNPVCVKRISELYESYYLDSLFYNDLGQLVKKNCYESTNGYNYDLYVFAEYTYNDKGQKTKCDVYTNQYFIYHESTIHYHYDGNDRLSYMEVDYMEDDWGEKISFVYNGDDLIVEETYSSDYGNGYIDEEMTKYTYDERLLVKEEYFYIYENECYEEGYYIYEYDEHGNCISETEYYGGELDWKIEYTHNLDVSYSDVYYYTDAEEDYYVEPSHANMITSRTEYVGDENELYVDCVYEYEYDDMLDIVETQVVASNIYPNPVEDILNVEAENIDLVELYDIYGRKLYSEVKSDNVRIDMNNFSDGVYFVKIYSEGKSSVEKIMKE